MVVAQALQRIHGGQVMGLVRKDGIVEHAVVQNGDTMYDFDGLVYVEEVIKRFESNERTNITDVRPITTIRCKRYKCREKILYLKIW